MMSMLDRFDEARDNERFFSLVREVHRDARCTSHGTHRPLQGRDLF